MDGDFSALAVLMGCAVGPAVGFLVIAKLDLLFNPKQQEKQEDDTQ